MVEWHSAPERPDWQPDVAVLPWGRRSGATSPPSTTSATTSIEARATTRLRHETGRTSVRLESARSLPRLLGIAADRAHDHELRVRRRPLHGHLHRDPQGRARTTPRARDSSSSTSSIRRRGRADMVRLRTNYRGEDVYLYRLRAHPAHVRAMSYDYLREINPCATRPHRTTRSPIAARPPSAVSCPRTRPAWRELEALPQRPPGPAGLEVARPRSPSAFRRLRAKSRITDRPKAPIQRRTSPNGSAKGSLPCADGVLSHGSVDSRPRPARCRHT